MAAGPFVFYEAFAQRIADGTIDLDTDVLKAALFTSAHTPAPATDVSFSALTGEVAGGTGYTAGGDTLASVDLTETGGVATLEAANTVWTAAGGPITSRYLVLYSSTPATNNLIGYFLLDNTPADVTVTDTNTLTIEWNALGIVTITV